MNNSNDVDRPLPHDAHASTSVPGAPLAGEVPAAAVAHAERLVEELGSVDLAKQAVDLAKQAVEAVASQAEPRATDVEIDRALGYESYQALMEASSPLESSDGRKWFITHLPDDSWVAWNEVEHKCDRHYVTAEEARASVPLDTGFTGSSLLG